MFQHLIEDVLVHAKECVPNECCGLAVETIAGVIYYPTRNQSSGESFLVDPLDYIKASRVGTIVGICHSHVMSTCAPSQSDIVGCNSSKLPWLIVAIDGSHSMIYPESFSKYEGRRYEYGTVDCYTVVQDYYRQELGIDLPRYPSTDLWWQYGQSLYEEHFPEQFDIVTEPKLHDIILMAVDSNIGNHPAIYLGNNRILHHPRNRLSMIDRYGFYWKRATKVIYRHRSLL